MRLHLSHGKSLVRNCPPISPGLNIFIVRRALEQAERKPDSLDRLRAYLADPDRDPQEQAFFQGALDNLADIVIPPTEYSNYSPKVFPESVAL